MKVFRAQADARNAAAPIGRAAKPPEALVLRTRDEAALRNALRGACVATAADVLQAARARVEVLPHQFVCEHIERAAADVLDLDDEWQFRRLLELVSALGALEAQARLVHQGMRSANPEVREAAVDFMPFAPACLDGRTGAGRRASDAEVREKAHVAFCALRLLLDGGHVPEALRPDVIRLLESIG